MMAVVVSSLFECVVRLPKQGFTEEKAGLWQRGGDVEGLGVVVEVGLPSAAEL